VGEEPPAGAAALRAACCDVLARANAAECFCKDEAMALLRTFLANFRAIFDASPAVCGVGRCMLTLSNPH
jgi:hypothetical protein